MRARAGGRAFLPGVRAELGEQRKSDAGSSTPLSIAKVLTSSDIFGASVSETTSWRAGDAARLFGQGGKPPGVCDRYRQYLRNAGPSGSDSQPTGGPTNAGQSSTVSQTSIPVVQLPVQRLIARGPPIQQRSPGQSFGEAHSSSKRSSEGGHAGSSGQLPSEFRARHFERPVLRLYRQAGALPEQRRWPHSTPGEATTQEPPERVSGVGLQCDPGWHVADPSGTQASRSWHSAEHTVIPGSKPALQQRSPVGHWAELRHSMPIQSCSRIG